MFAKLNKLLLCTAAVSPVLLMAFSTGPPQGRTGAAIDGGQNCTACHLGSPANNGDGKLTITTTPYTPGVKQTITVKLEHPTARRWGFQLTARINSDQTKKAGALTPNNDVRVRCGLTGTQEAPCGQDLEFVEHIQDSTGAGTSGSHSWTFDWTPPETNVGDVIFFAAGNAANNSQTNAGDFIYTTSLTISPQSSDSGGRPAISRAGIVDAFSFSASIASNGWIAIFGTNLASGTRTWDDAIVGKTLPTSLSGVQVKVNNKLAPIYFVSSGQINALAPLDDAVGDVSVVVSTSAGESDPMVVKKAVAAPAFYAPFASDNRLYVTARALDGTTLGKVGVDPSAVRAAKPGETILLFASGCGATDPAVPIDQIVEGSPALVSKPTIRINDIVVDFPGNGNLVSAGLYQFNVTIPDTLADGDYAIVGEAGGLRGSSSVFISVAK